MNIREARHTAAAIAAFCVTLFSMLHKAHASVRLITDSLETSPTDWTLWYDASTPGPSLAYHYGNNAALARSGTGVTFLQSGAHEAAMWKTFYVGNDVHESNISGCSFSVYLRKVFSPTQRVLLSLVSLPDPFFVAQKYVDVTSTSYTAFSVTSPPSGFECQSDLQIWIEALGDGPLTGVAVDDIAVKWEYF